MNISEKKYQSRKRILFFFGFFVCFSAMTQAQSKNTLWYKQAAKYFEESLPLGNGRIGAMVFGGADSDKIFLNDITLWSGEPVNPNMNPEAHTHIAAIRAALQKEDYKQAEQLQKKVQGKFSESYAPLGTLYLDFGHNTNPENYRRELNLSNAIAKTTFKYQDTEFSREYFVSNPDKVLAIRVSGTKKGQLNFKIRLNSLLKNVVSSKDKTLNMSGRAPIKAQPNYLGNIANAVVSVDERGTRFATLIGVKTNDGTVMSTDTTLEVSQATEAFVYVSIATSFNGYNKNAASEGLDEQSIAAQQLNKAMAQPFDELKKRHIADYQKFFGRVNLDLGSTTAPDLPTDERLKRYALNNEDRNLEVLYFQFGRYLLISSSRTLGVPANLQGLWNPHLRPPWSSNYTININLEENYWLAENTNLSELHLPLMSFIKNLSETGKITAKTFYGVSKGWAAAHNSDIWAMSNPVGDFGKGDPMWANWNMGGTWLSTHLWEHYAYTQDIDFLRKDGYPLMKGASEFCLNWLVEDKNGRLITSPSTSPENQYKTPDGFRGATFYGATSDLAMIRELFTQTILASQILKIDKSFRDSLSMALDKLHPYQVSQKGHLQEWYHDWEDADPKHRHQSHLFGLYPGSQISPQATPTLADACRKSLEIKGDETTGWSKGWRINLWARLLDGNHAYKMIRELMKYVEPDGMKTNYARGGGTYPNLFDAHPPFQIDGNFGGSAAFAEMLVQSSIGQIVLLPALPDAWPDGSVSGLCARGGFEISMKWKNKKPLNVTIYSKKGGQTSIHFGDKTKKISLKAGQSLTLSM
jgi:alpha-L-fucosidase 2